MTWLCDCFYKGTKVYYEGVMRPVMAIDFMGNKDVCPKCHHYCFETDKYIDGKNPQATWKKGINSMGSRKRRDL